MDNLRKKGSTNIVWFIAGWALLIGAIYVTLFKDASDWWALLWGGLTLGGWFVIADWWHDGVIDGVYKSGYAQGRLEEKHRRDEEKQK